MAVAFVDVDSKSSATKTSAGYQEQQNGRLISSHASLKESAAGKRPKISSSGNAQLPTAKRQKLQSSQAQHQLDAAPISPAGAAQEAKGAAANHSKAPKAPGCDNSAHGLHDSQDDLSSVDAASDDESGPGDPELGNLIIAESDERTLSNAMLEALRRSVQDRLQQYPSQALEQDKAALSKAQTAAKR